MIRSAAPTCRRWRCDVGSGLLFAIYKVKIDLDRINKNRNKEPALKDCTVHFQSHFLIALTGSKPNKQFISACLYGDCFRSLTGGKVMCFTTSCSSPSLKCWNCARSLWEFLKREPKTQKLRYTESRSHDTFVLGKGIYPVFGGGKIWDLSICSPAWHCECWRQSTSPAFD